MVRRQTRLTVRSDTGSTIGTATTALGSGQGVTWIRDLVTPFRADALHLGFAALCECDGRATTP